MKLIIGLGNPGSKFEKTRHNIGFMTINALVRGLGLPDFKLDKKLEAEIVKEDDTIYAKPQTYMNESGRAIQKISNFYKITPENITIIHDDKDMIFGKIRTRDKGSSGGHNGIKSIIEYLGTENFSRIKIGIQNPDKPIKDTSKYVLKNFSRKQKKELENIIDQAIKEIHNLE